MKSVPRRLAQLHTIFHTNVALLSGFPIAQKENERKFNV